PACVSKIPRPPGSPLFPYPTLFRSRVAADVARLKGEALAIERSTTPRQPGIRKYARRKAAVAKAREKKLDRYLASEERVEKPRLDRKSTRLNSSHVKISYAVFCLKK